MRINAGSLAAKSHLRRRRWPASHVTAIDVGPHCSWMRISSVGVVGTAGIGNAMKLPAVQQDFPSPTA
jgi:hypothetical protein